jgi:hypothetical protein
MFGKTPWSSDEFTNANFRVRLTANLGELHKLYLDRVHVQVDYNLPPPPDLSPYGEPPDTSIISYPSSPTASTSASFTRVGSDDVTPVGDLRYRYWLDSGIIAGETSLTSITFDNLWDGSHYIEVRAVDPVGIEDPTPVSYTWVVDRPPYGYVYIPSYTKPYVVAGTIAICGGGSTTSIVVWLRLGLILAELRYL